MYRSLEEVLNHLLVEQTQINWEWISALLSHHINSKTENFFGIKKIIVCSYKEIRDSLTEHGVRCTAACIL